MKQCIKHRRQEGKLANRRKFGATDFPTRAPRAVSAAVSSFSATSCPSRPGLPWPGSGGEGRAVGLGRQPEWQQEGAGVADGVSFSPASVLFTCSKPHFG